MDDARGARGAGRRTTDRLVRLFVVDHEGGGRMTGRSCPLWRLRGLFFRSVIRGVVGRGAGAFVLEKTLPVEGVWVDLGRQ
jgi:hypothetical protein